MVATGVTCEPCLARLCVTKDGNGRVTAVSFRDGSGNLIPVPTCASGSGSGSGSGGSGGGSIISACCTTGLLPSVLYLNFSGATGSCGCFNSYQVAMTYQGSDALGWDNLGVDPTHPCTSGVQIARFTCGGGTWHVNFGAPGGCTGIANGAVGSCSGNIVASGTMSISQSGPGSCCVGNVNVTVTKT